MPKIITMCGISHAGKTTKAEEIARGGNFEIINTDKIRVELHGSREMLPRDEKEVWSLFALAKSQALQAEKDIILDACHISRNARWHALNGVNSSYRKVCILLIPPLRKIRRRVRKTGRIELSKVEAMHTDFDVPTKAQLLQEGFNEVRVLRK